MASTQGGQASTAPIPLPRMTEIANEACKTTFASVESYKHSSTSAWNTNIINTILQSLISETSSSGQQPAYKYAVTSTIIQHMSAPGRADGEMEGGMARGKRGMHSATGAYWNNERDGMWSYKYEEEEKGFDVVISVIWISVI